MSAKVPKACAEPGCAALTTDGRFCDTHRRAERRQYDDRRGSSTKRGYDSKWQRAREAFLREHPLCRMCAESGQVTPATLVDHIRAFRAPDGSINEKLRWSRTNWQSLCTPCHSGDKQRQDRTRS